MLVIEAFSYVSHHILHLCIPLARDDVITKEGFNSSFMQKEFELRNSVNFQQSIVFVCKT